ncbi:MAG TPA: calcium/proton exchanger [Bacilli bacterium]
MPDVRVFLIATFVLSAIAHYAALPILLQFLSAAAAIVFVAGFLGRATESVAHYAGERMGGFLNATFGNAAELIIAIFLVKNGMFDMVKASITGSIIGNMLLVLGLSVLIGGSKFKTQRFNIRMASHNASMMTLAVIALFVPAVFIHEFTTASLQKLSLIVAGGLIAAYLLWLVFSMITHKDELADETGGNESHTPWSKGGSIFYLLLATIMVAFVSEWLVATLEPITHRFGLSELFVGAFVIAIVGNAAEHSAAVMMAAKNKIGAAVEIAIGSSLQIALFVAPALVFASLIFGKPMDLIFTVPELTAIAVSVFIAKSISQDGKTNWYEGVLLLVVYLILASAFFFA